MTLAMIGSLLLAAQAAAAPAEGRPSAGAVEKRSRPSQGEPMAPALSLKTAADHLDRMAVGWTRQHHCGSCHSNYPFLMARPALKEFDSPATGEVRAFLETRVAHWDDADAEAKPRWDAEVVSTAEALAINDAETTGVLHPLTRKALDRMWTLQKPDGGWDWLKCGWPPLEHDDYYGAIVAALAVGHAPEGYAAEPVRPGRDSRSSAPISGRRLPRPAPPDHAPLGLHPPRRPDGPGAEGGRHSRGPGAPARRRWLVPALPGQLEAARRHSPTIPPRPATATPPGWSSSCSARPACRPPIPRSSGDSPGSRPTSGPRAAGSPDRSTTTRTITSPTPGRATP